MLYQLEVSVAASADDGSSNNTPSYATGGSSVAVGRVQEEDAWFRFVGVAVPQGAIITDAYLEVVATGGAANVRTNLYGNDADNAVAPTDRATHVAKARTTAFVARDVPPAWTSGNTYQVDASAIIQAIVDRPGWASGNALMLLWDDDGTAVGDYLTIAAWNNETAAAPLLHIEWEGPAEFGPEWLISAAEARVKQGRAAARRAKATIEKANVEPHRHRKGFRRPDEKPKRRKV
jgi:hypothetical protein